jgi:phosphatidylserine/phosphatidylglycerophosphate/cardiolipin synthase-like enzyme
VNPNEPLRTALARVAAEEPGARDQLEQVLEASLASGSVTGLSRELSAEITRAQKSRDHVSVVATGIGWVGGGAGAIERRLANLIAEAERELVLAVYVMSRGPARVWSALEKAIDGGISCTLVADRLDSQDPEMRKRLQALRDRHRPTFRVLDFVGETDRDHLHAKIVVADRRRALIGSANLTAHGLLLGHELAVCIDGPAAEEIAARIDMLGRSSLVRPLP